MELLRGDRDVVRVGHRGAATLAPENTLAAIEAAANAGVDAVEVDVLCRADGALVIAHGPGLPLDAPPLDDALALVARLGLAVQLDVKLPALAEGCVAALRAHGLLGRSFVSSLVPRALTYPEDRHGVTGNRFLRPAVRPGLAAMRAVLPLRLPRFLRAVDARAATLHWAVVTPAVVAACHASGAAVYVWTVNERALARTLVESGIDGIITDDPRILARGIWRDLKHDLKTT
jgi:glycerophosphoryl diester phosphodiesterase